ncbi:hypothetical protein KUH32_04460 [Thalassococcus sp. CAU 1522]|uniref:Uncharacterized protein n=1 Tax=Thalassococcus arenae TaxID=2851652 RepID=A0ABS6N5Z8_9RHOB|nr:hypothetical protein [Thalassococcus arenae]MBV2359019.1 hypothetical protein [Thalassococcus arenae]
MPQHRYPIATAAQLAEASYSAATHRSVAPRVKRSLDEGDVQAHLLDNGVLLIPGSNSAMDYLKFNLRVLMIGGRRFSVRDGTTERGASGTIWHQGFLRHAKAIYDWIEAGGERPVYVIGHSLGAAATQILSKSWAVPGIGFAAPRPRKARGAIRNDGLCLCINRDDDIVCGLPGAFHHMGRVQLCRAARSRLLANHSMPHYRAVVSEAQQAGQMPVHWPA